MSGVHIVGPVRQHDQHLRQWAANGLQLAVTVKPEPGDAGYLRGILGAGGFIAGRFTNDTNLTDSQIQSRLQVAPQEEARDMLQANLAGCHYAANPEINCYLIHNEPVFDKGNLEHKRFQFQQLNAFYREAVDRGTAVGVGIALYAFSVGTPEPEDWPLIYDTWRYALSRNAELKAKTPHAEHILALHQYGPPNHRGRGSLFIDTKWYLRRFEELVRPTLPDDLKQAPYVVTESGPELSPGGWREAYGDDVEGLAEDWQLQAEWAATQPGCKGHAFFTLGQEGGFTSYDIRESAALPALASRHYPRLQPANSSAPAPAPAPTPQPSTIANPVRVKTSQGVIIVDQETDYLPAVVGSELLKAWLDEGATAVVKAQAVAARSYVEWCKRIRKAGAYDVDAGTNDQVYNPAKRHPNATKAVAETRGQVLTYKGNVIRAFFSSRAGGTTRSYKEWQGVEVPYLQAKPAYDAQYGVRYGHGVGLSQYGAWDRSKAGWNHKQILTHFYTDVELQGYTEEAPTVIRRNVPTKHTSSRAGRRAVYYIIHSTGPVQPTSFEASHNWLVENPRQVSAHKLIGPNEVVTYAPDNLATHHVGGSRLPNGSTGLQANQDSYGVELYQSAPGKPVEPAVVALAIEETIADCKRLGIPASRVLGHWEVDLHGKVDPVGVNMLIFRARVAAGLQDEARDWPKAIWHIQERVRVSRGMGDIEASETLLYIVLPWMDKRASGMPASPIEGDSSDWDKTMWHSEQGATFARDIGDIIAYDTLADEVLPWIEKRRDGQ